MNSSVWLNILKWIGIGIGTIAAAYIVISLFCYLLCYLVGRTVNLKKEYDRPSTFYRKWFNFAYRVLTFNARIHIKSTGTELLKQIPEGQKFLFVSNHRSNFDNMLHSLVLDDYDLAFISKPGNFKIPIGRFYMHRLCYISIDRGNIRSGLSVITRATDMVKNGITNMAVFPEGTRSKTGNLLEFHPGCLKIATNSNCPIVIAATSGTEQIHKRWPWRSTTCHVDIIKVMMPQEYEGKKTVQISDEIRQMLLEKLGH